jgi:hypothetical protein
MSRHTPHPIKPQTGNQTLFLSVQDVAQLITQVGALGRL